jgi:hypothetical protein
VNEGLRVRCGPRSSPLRVGRRHMIAPNTQAWAGSGNPGSDRGETGRTAENRRGPQRTGKDRKSCRLPCRGARESPAKCRHCRGCGNSPEPITIRSRTCRRRSWWTTPCNVIHSTAPPVGPSPNPCAVHTGHRRGDRTPAETRGVRPRPASDPEPAGRAGRGERAGKSSSGTTCSEQSRDRHDHDHARLGDRTTTGPKRDR